MLTCHSDESRLSCRTLSDNSFTGMLPLEWGWTPRFSLLKNLKLDQNARLSATLPSAWGASGGFPSLQVRWHARHSK